MRSYSKIKSFLCPVFNIDDESKKEQVKSAIINIISASKHPVKLSDISFIFFQQNILYRIYDTHLKDQIHFVYEGVKSLVKEKVIVEDTSLCKTKQKLFDDGNALYSLPKDIKRDILLDRLLS